MPENVQITLPDGSSKQVPAGTTVADSVKTQIGAGLAKAALYAKLDGQELDLSRPLVHGGKLTVITSKQREGLDLIRHDAAHVVASVLQRLFPGTQVTIGPHTEDGFYYHHCHRAQRRGRISLVLATRRPAPHGREPSKVSRGPLGGAAAHCPCSLPSRSRSSSRRSRSRT